MGLVYSCHGPGGHPCGQVRGCCRIRGFSRGEYGVKIVVEGRKNVVLKSSTILDVNTITWSHRSFNELEQSSDVKLLGQVLRRAGTYSRPVHCLPQSK